MHKSFSCDLLENRLQKYRFGFFDETPSAVNFIVASILNLTKKFLSSKAKHFYNQDKRNILKMFASDGP